MAENPAFYLHLMGKYINTVAEADKILIIKALDLIVRADPSFYAFYGNSLVFHVIIDDLLNYISNDINTFIFQHFDALEAFNVVNNFISGQA